MNAVSPIESPLALLRVPFAEHHISKLPKPTKAQTDEVKADFKAGIRCKLCKGWHHPKVEHLDYVGHAALTDRLLDADPHWNWEPMGFNPDGTPALDRNGGLWIKLTVCGVTRPGYGAADGKQGGDAVKEMIGDALRNAAMRFGAALDLWHKGDLHPDDATEIVAGGQREESAQSAPGGNLPHTGEPAPRKREKLDGPYTSKTALWAAFKAFDRELRGCGDSDEFELALKTKEAIALMEQLERDAPTLVSGGAELPEEYVSLNDLIAQRRHDFEQLAKANYVADMARA